MNLVSVLHLDDGAHTHTHSFSKYISFHSAHAGSNRGTHLHIRFCSTPKRTGNMTFPFIFTFVNSDKRCRSDLPFRALPPVWENRRFPQRSPATVQGNCVGGNMKGRNLNVSDTASTMPRWIPLRTLGRLAAGMRNTIL